MPAIADTKRFNYHIANLVKDAEYIACDIATRRRRTVHFKSDTFIPFYHKSRDYLILLYIYWVLVIHTRDLLFMKVYIYNKYSHFGIYK